MSREKWTTDNIPDLTGKTIIVTGGNSGLGFESAKAFASKGAEVVLTSRTVEKGEKAKGDILKLVPGAKVVVASLDLADLSSVKSFADYFNKTFKRLDVLLNNAGIMMSPYHLTKDDFEGQMGTNHIGHFLLTGLLKDKLKETEGSRVVNVSSSAHKAGKMDFDNLLFDQGKDYTAMKAYGRSKLANLLFTYELQKYFEKNNFNSISVAAHPGASQTNLDRYLKGKLAFRLLKPLFYMMTQSASNGALPQIRASVDPAVNGGEYYGPFNGVSEMSGYPKLVKSNAASHNKEDARRLWEESESLTGIKY